MNNCKFCPNIREPRRRLCLSCHKKRQTFLRSQNEHTVGSREFIAKRFFVLKHRAMIKHLEFDLTKEDVKELLSLKFCAYCEEAFNYTEKRRKLTVERVDNSKGYVKGNCASVCSHCNHKKANLTRKQIINMYNCLMK